MSVAEMVEASAIAGEVEDLTDPKEVLEKIAKSEPIMFTVPPEKVRILAYGSWLKDHGPEGWYDFYVKTLSVLNKVLSGCGETVSEEELIETSSPPEGWVAPTSYIQGVIPKEE